MKTGDIIARDNGKVLVLAWKDKRLVKAISTKHDASTTTISRRKKRGGGAMEEVRKPVCIVDYNKHMCGVDLMDQMISYYPFTRKTMKWTKRVFFYLMEISAHNAFVLYKAKSSRKRYNSMFKFVLQLIRQLIELQQAEADSAEVDDVTPRSSKQPRMDPPDRLRGGFKRHKITVFPPSATKKAPYKQCRVCRKKGRRHDTKYCCANCGVALCASPCFHDYHTKNVYA